MKEAGYFILLSAILHVVGVLLAPSAWFLIVPAVLYVFLYTGLAREMRFVGWIAFICMLGGSVGTIVELTGSSVIETWVLWGILGADVVAGLLLFAALWEEREA